MSQVPLHVQVSDDGLQKVEAYSVEDFYKKFEFQLFQKFGDDWFLSRIYSFGRAYSGDYHHTVTTIFSNPKYFVGHSPAFSNVQ